MRFCWLHTFALPLSEAMLILNINNILSNDSSAIKLKLVPGYLGKWLEIHSTITEDRSMMERSREHHSFENRV